MIRFATQREGFRGRRRERVLLLLFFFFWDFFSSQFKRHNIENIETAFEQKEPPPPIRNP